MHCLDLVQVQRYAPARSDIRDVAVCNFGSIKIHVDIGRSDYADPAESGQMRGEPFHEYANVHAGRDGNHADRDRTRGAAEFRHCLKVLDDLPRDHHRQLGTCREQSVECRFGKPHQHRIAYGHHRGATRLASDEAHLANDLAAAHFATVRGMPSSSLT